MDIKNIINHYQKIFFNRIEIEHTDQDSLEQINYFLQTFPITNHDPLFVDFIKNYVQINLSIVNNEVDIFGAEMILELDEPPLKNNDFLGFANYSRLPDEGTTISSTFFLDLSNLRKPGVYVYTIIWKGSQKIKESGFRRFSNNFQEFLQVIFGWLEIYPSFEEILNYSID